LNKDETFVHGMLVSSTPMNPDLYRGSDCIGLQTTIGKNHGEGLASVLILRTLRKANHRVPEETQASSVGRYDPVAPQLRFRSRRPQL